MAGHLAGSIVALASLVVFLLSAMGCQAVKEGLPLSSAWQNTPLRRANAPAEVVDRLPALKTLAPAGRIIFVGVHGGNPPSWENAEWFDPQDWPPYLAIDLKDERAVSQIAYHESVMHVVALHIARRFPNSITIMIRGDSQVLSDVLDAVYRRGDRILLAGHSFGGRVIEELARDFKRRQIPIDSLIYIESFWSKGLVPSNVKRALNFYVPVPFAVCRGLERITAEDANRTELINVAVSDPEGPYSGLCSEHRNIDSDRRVWKAIVDHMIDKIDR